MNKLTISTLVASVMLTGCIQLPNRAMTNPPQKASPMPQERLVVYKSLERGTDVYGGFSQVPHYQGDKRLLQSVGNRQHITAYVKNLAQDLIGNMANINQKTTVGVTHFSRLEGDLNQTSLLGLQIAESFMHELHSYRIPVVDYKATEFVRVTEDGDFLLSRDFLELEHKIPINFVLTGTMTKHTGGVLVNARIINMDNKVLVASSQALIPNHVVDSLVSDTDETMGINIGVSTTLGQ